MGEDEALEKKALLGKRSLDQTQKATLEELLKEKDFENMMEFYAGIEPEKAKLVIKNDVRKLENTLKRLLVHQNTEYTWKYEEKDFLIFALDTTNVKWLEARITKRIREMVCDEGGLQETFALLFTMVLHFWKEEHPKSTKDAYSPEELSSVFKEFERISLTIQSKTSHGVLQAIGYKEFIPIFQ